MVVPVAVAGAACCGAAVASIYDDEEENENGATSENSPHPNQPANPDDESPLSPITGLTPENNFNSKRPQSVFRDGKVASSSSISRQLHVDTVRGSESKLPAVSAPPPPSTFMNSMPNKKAVFVRNRHDSSIAFIRPVLSREETALADEDVDEEEDMMYTDIRTTVHNKSFDGGLDEVEVDFNDSDDDYYEGKTCSSIGTPTSGYVDGDFFHGKVRDIVAPSECFLVKFNSDSTILSIGLQNGGGVALYETKNFTLLHTIQRADTVSALDWIQRSESQLLAVGGFDGSVSIYSVNMVGFKEQGPILVHDVIVGSEVRSMSFLHSSFSFDEILVLAVGERSGMVSVFTYADMKVEGNIDSDNFPPLKGNGALFPMDKHQSSVLSLSFSCNESGILIACGTKEGLIRVNSFHVNQIKRQITFGQKLYEFNQNGATRCLKFSHDSSRLFAGGYDTTLAIIDTHLWKLFRSVKVDGTVNSIEFDPMSKYIVIGSRARTMTVYDTSTYQPIKVLNTTGWVSSLSWGTNSMSSFIAMRGENQVVSLIKLEPIHSLDVNLKSSRGEGSSISWSYDGRFLARSNGTEVLISDAKRSFADVARIRQTDIVRCVRFCHAEGSHDRLAIIDSSGILRFAKVRISVGNVFLQDQSSVLLPEKDLSAMSWSTDGSFIVAGGKGKMLHVISVGNYTLKCNPIPIEERIRTIDILSQHAYAQGGPNASSFSIAIGTGENVAKIMNDDTLEVTMEVSRSRSVRCLRYHPTLPILAIGDGSSCVVIVDLIEEIKIAEFSAGGRVNSIDFSPGGDFLAVAADGRGCTLLESLTLKVVQEIPLKGFAVAVAFSGINGKHLAIADSYGETQVIDLGPLLSLKFIPIATKGGLSDMPSWAQNEAIYRSGEEPSFLQRCMLNGSQESLIHAATIMRESPDAIFAFNRRTGDGCFDIAVKLRKPNILKLVLTILVDGTLEARQGETATMLVTKMPTEGLKTLKDLILHHPPEFAMTILKNMNFIKVPFTEPRRCLISDNMECGSSSYTDPWGSSEAPLKRIERIMNDHILDAKENKDEIFRVPAVLPLPGLGSFEFLSLLTTETNSNMFDNDAMGLVLNVMWNSGVRRYFLADFILYIVLFVCWVLLVDSSAHSTSSSGIFDWPVKTLIVIVLMLNTLLFTEEFIQSNFLRRREHFRSMWNFVDILGIALVYSYVITVMSRGIGKGSVTLAVITTLILTVKFVAYLRGFDNTGWLVTVLMQNFFDVRGFVIVLVAILLGFTVAFRLLFGDVEGGCSLTLGDSSTVAEECDRDPFGTLSRSLLSTFELTILGTYETSMFFDSQNTPLAILTFVIAITVILVVALNALIAVLGDSYSRVQENATANRRKERAELIVEYLSMMPKWQRNRIEHNTQYFHALLEADADGDLLVNKDDWQGGLNALKRELSEMNEANNESMRKNIDALRTELTEEIGALRNEMTSVLSEIAVEVKSMAKMQRDGGITFNNKNVANAVKVVKGIGKNLHPFRGNGILRLGQGKSSREDLTTSVRDLFKNKNDSRESSR